VEMSLAGVIMNDGVDHPHFQRFRCKNVKMDKVELSAVPVTAGTARRTQNRVVPHGLSDPKQPRQSGHTARSLFPLGDWRAAPRL